jgi:phage-related protein
MGFPKWEVEFFEKSNGRCPTIDFLRKLNKQDRVFIDNAFDRLEQYGRQLDRPHVGFLRDHIWELRVRTNHGIYRFLYFFIDNHKFVITHGFSKKSGKVPDSEIDKAIEFREDYISRK